MTISAKPVGLGLAVMEFSAKQHKFGWQVFPISELKVHCPSQLLSYVAEGDGPAVQSDSGEVDRAVQIVPISENPKSLELEVVEHVSVDPIDQFIVPLDDGRTVQGTLKHLQFPLLGYKSKEFRLSSSMQ